MKVASLSLEAAFIFLYNTMSWEDAYCSVDCLFFYHVLANVLSVG